MKQNKLLMVVIIIKELKQTVTPNNKYLSAEQIYTGAFWISVHFLAILCKTITWSDQNLHILDNINHDDFGIECSHNINSLIDILDC